MMKRQWPAGKTVKHGFPGKNTALEEHLVQPLTSFDDSVYFPSKDAHWSKTYKYTSVIASSFIFPLSAIVTIFFSSFSGTLRFLIRRPLVEKYTSRTLTFENESVPNQLKKSASICSCGSLKPPHPNFSSKWFPPLNLMHKNQWPGWKTAVDAERDVFAAGADQVAARLWLVPLCRDWCDNCSCEQVLLG